MFPNHLIRRLKHDFERIRASLGRDQSFVSKAEYDALLGTLESTRGELASAYETIKAVDAQRISAEQRLSEALRELGPARFISNHYKSLRDEQRIIELDFKVNSRSRDWSDSPHIQRLVQHLNERRSDWLALLRSFLEHERTFLSIPLEETGPSCEPYWLNGWLPGLDGVALYSFLVQRKPAIFFEVGSGNSTKFVRKAIRDHNLQTRIVSVDPFPRAEIDEICDTVYRVGLEDFELDVLSMLSGNDIVFIDNSHRSFSNSDVTVFFLEMLGRLPSGILYGLHDIFLPYDYPEDWSLRFYNEQYLLAAYLFGGAAGDRIVMPGSYISHDAELTAALDVIWKSPSLEGILPYGGGFWLQKG